ncbi:hypothetical protein D9M69_624160 [compost metagenome]
MDGLVIIFLLRVSYLNGAHLARRHTKAYRGGQLPERMYFSSFQVGIEFRDLFGNGPAGSQGEKMRKGNFGAFFAQRRNIGFQVSYIEVGRSQYLGINRLAVNGRGG